MTLINFNSLPTTSRWPSAAWTTDPIYTLSNDDTNEFPEPFGFAVNSSAGLVGVTMLFSPSTHMGSLQEYHTSNGDLVQTLNPPFPGSRMDEGCSDPGPSRGQERLVLLADDWYTSIIGICLAGACT